ESPRWLIKNGRAEPALRILARIGGQTYAEGEVRNIQATIAAEEVARVHLRDLLAPKMLAILAIGCGVAVLQQLCGITVLFKYAENIFKSAGFHVNTTLFFIAITGIVNMAFTFVALASVDRWGRRSLMLFGCAGIALAHLLIGLAYLTHLKGVAV